MYNTYSAKQEMLDSLSEGNVFGVAEARSLFGITNVAARIAELRDEGHTIWTNTRKVNGKKVRLYRYGTPSSKKKAAARRAAYTGRA